MHTQMETVNKIKDIFSTDSGRAVYESAVRAISDFGMCALIESGVLVGFSGGPDSVMLLLFLLEYRRRVKDFPIVCVHVNHSIRGDEAKRDENFSRLFSESLGVEFISSTYDVPAIAKDSGKGLEETARDVRYSCFVDIIQGRNDISAIAVAHNATDNLETVLLNIMRGAGARGAAGIPPVRANVIRPLIYVPKDDIVSLLDSCGIGYVIDSTNSSFEYSRNRIRNKIIPELKEINSSPENMATRLSRNLRRDDEYITTVALEFLSEFVGMRVLREKLISLHISVFSRVVAEMARAVGGGVSEIQIEKIRSLILGDDFSYDISGGRFVCERGVCRVLPKNESLLSYEIEIFAGKNNLPDYEAELVISDEEITVSSLNVYNFSIQANLSSAIINGRLFLRPKSDGDTVFFGGHTRKLKKLFNDYNVPPSLRDNIPILCDSDGIVWVPGIGVRDDRQGAKSEKRIFAYLSVGLESDDNYNSRFHIPGEFNNKSNKIRK